MGGSGRCLLCIPPFRGAAGGPDRAGSVAVQDKTAQKYSPAGYWGRGLTLAVGLIRWAGPAL